MTEKEICALLGKTCVILLSDGKWGTLQHCGDPATVYVKGEAEARRIPANDLVTYNLDGTILYEQTTEATQDM